MLGALLQKSKFVVPATTEPQHMHGAHEELHFLNLQPLQEWQTYQIHTLATTVAASPKVCVDLILFHICTHSPPGSRAIHICTKNQN